MFKDWKRALWRAPLHLLGSLPVALIALVVPPIGAAYVKWRQSAEDADVAANRDTVEKALVDFYTQTVFVSNVLKLWGWF